MLKINISEELLIDLLLNYCSGPLLNTMSVCIEQKISVLEINKCILETLIPHNILYSLSIDVVNRPQKLNEPISLCKSEIRGNAKLLMFDLKESKTDNIS